MNRFVEIRPWIVFSAALLLMIAGSVVIVYKSWQGDIRAMEAASENELNLLATLVRNDLRQGNYRQVHEILQEWGNTNSHVVALRLLAQNGFVLSDYLRETPAQHSLQFEQSIVYSNNNAASLELETDLQEVWHNRRELINQLALIVLLISYILFALIRLSINYRDESINLAREAEQRKTAEQALRESEERFGLAMRAVNDGLWDWNVESNEVYYSPLWKSMLGYTESELENDLSVWRELLHPDDLPMCLETVQACLEGKARALEMEFRMRHKEGHWVYIYGRGSVEYDEDGQPLRMIGTHVDVTSRKNIEIQLENDREQQAMLRGLLEIALAGESLEGTLDTCLEHILSVSWLALKPKGGIFLDNGDGLRPAVSRNLSAEIDSLRDQLASGTRPAPSAELQYADCVDGCHDSTFPGIPDHAHYCVPLVQNDKALGLLVLYLPPHFPRAPAKEEFLSAVGGILAAFIVRKQAEHALLESEQRFRVQFEHAPEAIVVLDADNHTFVDVNENAERLFGMTHEQLLRSGPKDVAPPYQPDGRPSAELTNEKIRLALAGAAPVFERTMRDARGRVFPCEMRLVKLPAAGRNLVRGSITDITERKHAEEELQQFKTTLDLTHDCVFMFEPDTLRFFYVNRGATEQVGYSAAELMQMTPVDIKPDYDETQFREVIAPMMAEGQATMVFETVHRHKDGHDVDVEIILQYISPLGEPPRFIAVVRDITERKRAEAAIRRFNEELEDRVVKRTAELASAKMDAERANQSKSEFLSRMSHELRTPMNAILGFGQLLKMDGRNPLSEAQTTSINEILNAGSHLLELINEILDLSSVESGKLSISREPVILAPLLEECLTLVKIAAENRGIRIHTKDRICDVTVLADRTRLKQVLVNLLSNAVKYNNEAGSITIDCRRREDVIQLRVTDTGPGLTPEQQERAFALFDRINADKTGVEGTGIGLALSKRLMELMHGKIGVESEAGKGSTFWIEAPLAESDEPYPALPDMAGMHDVAQQMPSDRVWDVLCIEDNPANLRLVELALSSRHDIHLTSAQHPVLGLEKALGNPPDLILLDIHLPDMDGYEVLKRLRDNDLTGDIPVIAISANAMSRDMQRARHAGFLEYFTKPLDVEHFLRTVDGLFASLAVTEKG